MRKILGRRGAALAGTACALLIGMSGAANADVIPPTGAIYTSPGYVSVMITGGESHAFNDCIADAKDGVINTAIVECNQVATVGNYVEIEDVDIIVSPQYRLWPIIWSNTGDPVDVWMTGGIGTAANACIADARDGVINTAIAMCVQVASAGNMVNTNSVNVSVYQ
jgi:hypothetical protein